MPHSWHPSDLNCTVERNLTICRIKYYHNNLIFKVARNFIAQTGDPKNDGSGGSSIYGCFPLARQWFRFQMLLVFRQWLVAVNNRA
jgi:cyclophilin family peptidyl-prolyl cis-trans isomerase